MPRAAESLFAGFDVMLSAANLSPGPCALAAFQCNSVNHHAVVDDTRSCVNCVLQTFIRIALANFSGWNTCPAIDRKELMHMVLPTAPVSCIKLHNIAGCLTQLKWLPRSGSC
jgi:hypothetical protein